VRRWAARIVALLATAALLGVGVAIAAMVRPDSESNANDQAARRTPTPTPAPHKTKKRAPHLTRSQRAARSAAVAQLRRRGYRPVRVADWHARQTLRVLLGARSKGGLRQAFFFAGRRYLGTDATTPTARLRVGRQSARTITLVYPIWRRGDKACCPHGGTARVRFHWDGARLMPQGAIPAADARRPGVG